MTKTTTMMKRKTTTGAPTTRRRYMGSTKKKVSTSLQFDDENSTLTLGRAKLHSSTRRTKL